MDAVKQITDALNSQIGTILTDYLPLDYVWFPEKNNFNKNDRRFGVSCSTSNQIFTTTCSFTVTQNFNISLTYSYKAVDEDDIDLNEKVFELYDSMLDVLTNIYKNKVGIPNLILQVTPISIDAPLIVEQSQLIILNAVVGIQFRYSIL